MMHVFYLLSEFTIIKVISLNALTTLQSINEKIAYCSRQVAKNRAKKYFCNVSFKNVIAAKKVRILKKVFM